MKVTLYIMRSGQESRASWSIAPEIDFAYWLDTAFRNEADQETKGILLASGYGNMNTIANELNGRLLEAKVIELIVWPYMLPLGLAQRISKHWPDSVRKGAGKKEIISHLTRQIRESKLMDMKMDQAHPMAQPVEIRTPDSPTSTDAVAARELARQACGAAM
ncbi:hypothetical protein K0U00_21075, partial [Paenibacillus sepulcri]|nr:hypothetical protein [Paenibacillus sepulcri]